MSQFRMLDTKRADGFYVQFERIEERDTSASPDDYDTISARRKAAWRRDDWHYIGVVARAHCLHVKNGVAFHLHFDSPGLWSIESDSGERYLNEVFAEQVADLKDTIAAMANPIFE